MSSRRRRLDRRHLLPRDYLTEPPRFGYQPDASMLLPAGGDPISLQVARVQHQVALTIRARHDRTATSKVTTAFGFSKQHWSDCLHGRAWMGETVLAAALTLLLDPPQLEPDRPPPPAQR